MKRIWTYIYINFAPCIKWYVKKKNIRIKVELVLISMQLWFKIIKLISIQNNVQPYMVHLDTV